MDMDISMDIHVKSVDMDVTYHSIHGYPGLQLHPPVSFVIIRRVPVYIFVRYI